MRTRAAILGSKYPVSKVDELETLLDLRDQLTTVIKLMEKLTFTGGSINPPPPLIKGR